MAKPTKPRSDFPLTPHSCGQFVKKHGGVQHYFGSDPETAEARYHLWEEAGRPRQVPELKSLPRRSDPAKPGKPKRPQGCPLWPHPNGSWAKKVKGRLTYFGPWADLPAAMERYHAHMRAQNGPAVVAGDPIALHTLINLFLVAKKKLIPAELSELTWDAYRRTGELLIAALGRDFRVDQMTQTDFQSLRDSLADGVALPTLSGRIGRAKVIFNWGYSEGYTHTPKYGASFGKPAAKVLRLHKKRTPKKRFKADQIHSMLEAASPQLRAMFLLGINCGFGNKDCSELRLHDLYLEEGRWDLTRSKTGVDRHGFLWPETVVALREVINGQGSDDLVFRTSKGNPWERKTEGTDDPIAKETAKLLKRLGIHEKGVGFYALRHTFYTIGRKARDRDAVSFIMGHTNGTNDMAAYYDEDDFDEEDVDTQRLKAVADYVHDWLFKRTHESGSESETSESDSESE